VEELQILSTAEMMRSPVAVAVNAAWAGTGQTVSAFVATLQGEVEQAQRAFLAAHLAGQPETAQRHRARLEDLLEVAERTGVDAEAWVDPVVLVILRED
jgi:hypothetical protein